MIELIIALSSAAIGAGATLFVPYAQRKVNETDRKAAALKAEQQRETDETEAKRRLLLGRMIAIRESTRFQLTELKYLDDWANGVGSAMGPPPRPPQEAFTSLRYTYGSTYNDIARFIGESYPDALVAYRSYLHEYETAVDSIGSSSRQDLAQVTDASYYSVRSKRDDLMEELFRAARDLGYFSVIAEDE
ncbi:hypothetical protein OHT77_19445 [Streptomyces sp. NBC_00252]|uniref:hypothetical protein n=1 Tax=Streptomyces sp. NBC_00252 TaxID=2975691 RepID=UPI002E2C161E|nr:hypothetical protein [Streptomyces sp. NBC_00252]